MPAPLAFGPRPQPPWNGYNGRMARHADASGLEREVYSPSRLNREVRALLEVSFPLLWVEGEVSNLSRPASGHIYFSLKDAGAQVRCAMFRQRNLRLDFRPENGAQVRLRARVSLYEARGDFQLIVEHMEEAGAGALQRAFEELKQRLAAEGLFAAEAKRPLPELPRAIGVVTSATGAALRDVLSVHRRRFPAIPLIIYPVPVQGEGAGERIAAALRRAGERGDCDVLLLVRGGGSLEDLWAFNEEVVARAIRACPIPVVSGVGHEVDVTIADFAADRRAPTPSAAAELVTPDREEWLATLGGLQRRLQAALRRDLEQRRRHLDGLHRRLKHPGRRLQEIAQRLDELEQRLGRAQQTVLNQRRGRLAELRAHLARHSPLHRLERLGDRCEALARRLHDGVGRSMEGRRQRLETAARALDTVSPLATLGRGYALVLRQTDGAVVRAHTEVARGDRVEARLAHGRLYCRVEETNDDDERSA